mgnify:CR=1 FL=1
MVNAISDTDVLEESSIDPELMERLEFREELDALGLNSNPNDFSAPARAFPSNPNLPPAAISGSLHKRVTIYSMLDGSPSEVMEYMVTGAKNSVLSWRDPQTNQRLWTVDKKKAPRYVPGTIKCIFHPQHHLRSYINGLGLTEECRKSNLRSEVDAESHAKRHSRSWAVYQRSVEKAEKDEERAERRAQMDALIAIAGGRHLQIAVQEAVQEVEIPKTKNPRVADLAKLMTPEEKAAWNKKMASARKAHKAERTIEAEDV